MLGACKESYLNLEENHRELGLNLSDIPTVFQWNKRDLRNVVPVEDLELAFNPKGFPSFQSVASDGSGVFETLRGITKLALSHIKTNVLGETNAPAAPSLPAAPPVSAPPVVEPPHASVEALTLSDLPSVTDLLDMEGSSYSAGAGSTPLPDEDEDSGFYIEAPNLPEHPGTPDEDISFLMDEELAAPPSLEPERALEPAPAPLPTVLEVLDTPQELLEPIPSLPEAAPVSVPVVMAMIPPPIQVTPPPVQLPPPPVQVHPPAKPAVKVDPLAALASLKMDTKRPVAKPKPLDHKDAINSLMGELTMVGRSGAPSVLRLDVPAEADGQEIEVFVQLRCKGQVVAEGQIHRPAPGKGSTAKLSVELKRS
jgi:hypothetical protein